MESIRLIDYLNDEQDMPLMAYLNTAEAEEAEAEA